MLTTDGSDHHRQQAQASASAGASDKRGHLTSFRAARKSLQSSAIDDSDEEASPAKAAEVSSAGLDAALLQSNLEENFFFNQKSSVKQSIEFVSGRLANNLIKTISQRIVTGELNRALAGLADDVTLLKSATADVSFTIVFVCMFTKIKTM